MTAIEFLEKLSQNPKKDIIDYLIESDVGDSFVEEFINNYKFKKRQGLKRFKDPIKDLVENYDGSTVNIGMVNFEIKPYEDSDYYYFAQFEVDLLAVDKNLKTVVLLQSGTSEVYAKCAQNGSKFLEALAEAAPYLARCGIDKDLYDIQDIACQMAEHCSTIAGGFDFIAFYKMLMGCDS